MEPNRRSSESSRNHRGIGFAKDAITEIEVSITKDKNFIVDII